MTLPRLCSRLAKLEAQRRPVVVADVLRRARQCAPSALQTFLLDAVASGDQATARAIMEQLTAAEFDALLGPELRALLETLPASELDAVARGDPGALARLQRAVRSLQHRGEDGV